MASIKGFAVGSSVVFTAEACEFYADRANVIHEVVDYSRAGYTVAPISGEKTVDWSRKATVYAEDLRAVG